MDDRTNRVLVGENELGEPHEKVNFNRHGKCVCIGRL
jgi:hypothetical protein